MCSALLAAALLALARPPSATAAGNLTLPAPPLAAPVAAAGNAPLSAPSSVPADPGLYVGVVYPRAETGLARSVERSLGSGPLRPVLAEAEAGLEELCTAWAGRRVAALVLFGPSPEVALFAAHLAIPTVWIGGHRYLQEDLGDSVIRLGPGVPQGLRALRSLLISWHWHSYTLLWGGPPLPGAGHLSKPPLRPIVYRLPRPPYTKVLATVSHSRRGVIALVGDSRLAKTLFSEATRLGMTDGRYVWLWLDTAGSSRLDPSALRRPRTSLLRYNDRLPVGLLRLVAGVGPGGDRHLVRATTRLLLESVRRVSLRTEVSARPLACWAPADSSPPIPPFTRHLTRELQRMGEEAMSGRGEPEGGTRALASRFQILNLVPRPELHNGTATSTTTTESNSVMLSDNWKPVGEVIGCCDVRLERIVWPGGNVGPCGGSRTVLKVVTAVAAPFVMVSESARGLEGGCLRGLPCDVVHDNAGIRYTIRVSCCYGLTMDLLERLSQELEFDFYLYMVPDSTFGAKKVNPENKTEVRWNGVISELMNGNAHLAFTALSITRPRFEVIDFSAPYYFSGVSFLAAPSQRTDIPLLAFLLPFSPELWVAIFTSLNVTAVAVAIYEWLSPFGLNPWGRQRTKNFSMSSALWVCWGLLCGHLVAFKAPKSWPNKFLINVWGGFSVIFVASYTANIAALIAGLFFHSATATPNDNSWLSQRVAAPEGSAAEYFVQRSNKILWEHMRRVKIPDVQTGVQMLKNGTLDILIADTPILDYYRATDAGCKLQKMGDAINDDMYGIGMVKGFPLKDSISSIIAKLTSNGYMDLLQEKWYGSLACFTMESDMSQPKPLGVSAVAGVFLLLGLGFVMGIVILIVEHLFYKYTLPILRHKPKGTIWRSRNIMFFSQKLYRFINCVELVSPHHAARELVHTIRQGQITSLFQKSVKRKEHEQRRRRKSKAQFFEMIQEIRRVQAEEKANSLSSVAGGGSPRGNKKSRSPQILSPTGRRVSRLPSRLELARRFSKDVFRSKSSGNLSLRRMSSDINFAASRFLECHSSQAIGRRLSRDTNPSPPDINSRRTSSFLTPELSVASAVELPLSAAAGGGGGNGTGQQQGQGQSSAAPGSSHLLTRSAVYLPAAAPPPPVAAALQSQQPPPEIAVHPPAPALNHPTPQHRFSYVDTGNPAFRERLARFTGEQRTRSDEMDERRRNAPSLLEQISTIQEQFPSKPKVVSVLPKNKSSSEMTLRAELASAVERYAAAREEAAAGGPPHQGAGASGAATLPPASAGHHRTSHHHPRPPLPPSTSDLKRRSVLDRYNGKDPT